VKVQQLFKLGHVIQVRSFTTILTILYYYTSSTLSRADGMSMLDFQERKSFLLCCRRKKAKL